MGDECQVPVHDIVMMKAHCGKNTYLYLLVSRTHGHVSSTDTSHKQDPARAHVTTHHCWLAAADAGLSIKQVTNCHESSFFSRQKLAGEKLLITFIVTQFTAASSGPRQYSALPAASFYIQASSSCSKNPGRIMGTPDRL